MRRTRRLRFVLLGTLLCVAVVAAPAGANRVPAPPGRIVFVSARTGTPQIWIMNRSGSEQTQLTNDSAPKSSPQLSPDRTRIVFQRPGDLDFPEIWVMNADGTNQHQVSQEGVSSDPAWSPDGTQIAMVRITPPAWGIWVVNADRTRPTSIRHGRPIVTTSPSRGGIRERSGP